MSAKTLSLHHLLKGAILLGFAVYIAYLAKTDRILYYIAPRMADYVKWSAVAFYAMAVYQIYSGIISLWGSREPDCDCEHLPSTSALKKHAAVRPVRAPPCFRLPAARRLYGKLPRSQKRD